MLARISFLILLFFLASCISRVDRHGFMFEFSDVELLQKGVTDKESVKKIMGSPTLVSDFGNNESWIYFSEDLESFLFFKPKIIKRKILLVSFDIDKISNLESFDLNSETNDSKFVSDFTNVDGHKPNFIKSIFSNVGQVKPQ